jgi:hypothetical protein
MADAVSDSVTSENPVYPFSTGKYNFATGTILTLDRGKSGDSFLY